MRYLLTPEEFTEKILAKEINLGDLQGVAKCSYCDKPLYIVYVIGELPTKKEVERIKEIVKKLPPAKPKRRKHRLREDRDKIIADLKSKKFTRKEIEKKYKLKGTRIYYWLNLAGMTINDLPKKKVEPGFEPGVKPPPTAKPPEEKPTEVKAEDDWEDVDEFAD